MTTFEIVTLASPVITSIVVWFFTKRHFQAKDLKQKDVHIEGDQADVFSKNLKIYQDMLDDVEKRYEDKLLKRDEEIQLLEEKILTLETLIQNLKTEIETLKNIKT